MTTLGVGPGAVIATQHVVAAMSEADSDAPASLRRTVSTSVGYHPDAEMSAIGLAVALGLLVVLLPLAPFLLAGWLVSTLLGFGRRRRRKQGRRR